MVVDGFKGNICGASSRVMVDSTHDSSELLITSMRSYRLSRCQVLALQSGSGAVLIGRNEARRLSLCNIIPPSNLAAIDF